MACRTACRLFGVYTVWRILRRTEPFSHFHATRRISRTAPTFDLFRLIWHDLLHRSTYYFTSVQLPRSGDPNFSGRITRMCALSTHTTRRTSILRGDTSYQSRKRATRSSASMKTDALMSPLDSPSEAFRTRTPFSCQLWVTSRSPAASTTMSPYKTDTRSAGHRTKCRALSPSVHSNASRSITSSVTTKPSISA